MVNAVFIFGARYLQSVIIIIAFVWFLIQPRQKQKDIIFLSCLCLPLIFIASILAGHIYYNPRPFVLEGFKPLIPHGANNGFPSHHALLASAIASVVFIFSRRLGLLLWGLALFVGFSRIYAGLHHVIDITAGILISIIIVFLTSCFMKYMNNRKAEGKLK